MVPKAIMYLIVNNAKDFINGELLAHLYATGDQVRKNNFDSKIYFTKIASTELYDGGKCRGSSETRGNAQNVSRMQRSA